MRGGGEGTRTPGLLRAREALYRLGYTPWYVQTLPAGGSAPDRPAAAQRLVLGALPLGPGDEVDDAYLPPLGR